MRTKREDILAASLEVFRDDGLRGAAMERIAAKASVSKRTLYKHFKTKEALFQAICAMILETLSSMTLPEYDPAKPIDSQLAEALESYIRQTMTPEFLVCSRVILAEFMRSAEAAQSFQAQYRRIDAPLSRIVSRAMSAGQLRLSDPDAATARLLALFKSLVLIPTLLNNVSPAMKPESQGLVWESVQAFLALYAPETGPEQ